MKIILPACLFCISIPSNAQTIVFAEGFDNVNLLFTNNWVRQNNSQPAGPETWRQGDSLVLDKNAYTGCDSCYLMNDWQATDVVGNGDISDWIITPELSLQNGDTVALHSISYNNELYPDRIEIRFSPNGNSTNAGVNYSDIGDFTNLVFSVNPALDTFSYPMWNWTRMYGVVTGLSGIVQGRLAIRYFVPNGGGTGSNSSTIGIDELKVIRPAAAFVNENQTIEMNCWPNPVHDVLNLKFRDASVKNITLLNELGQIKGTYVITETEKQLCTTGIDAGIYILKIEDAVTGHLSMVKFLKQ